MNKKTYKSFEFIVCPELFIHWGQHSMLENITRRVDKRAAAEVNLTSSNKEKNRKWIFTLILFKLSPLDLCSFSVTCNDANSCSQHTKMKCKLGSQGKSKRNL